MLFCEKMSEKFFEKKFCEKFLIFFWPHGFDQKGPMK